MSDDRTLPASPRRREAARREGALPPAALLGWTSAAATTILLLPAWGRATLTALEETLRTSIPQAVRAPHARPGLAELLPPGLIWPTVALVAAAGAVALAVRMLCDGLHWRPARALPTLARIDPGRGLARILSGRTLRMAAGDGLALLVLAAVVTLASGPLAGALTRADPNATGQAAHRTILVLGGAAAVVAALQWAWARRRFEHRLRMTPQEAREEERDAQADPRIRLLGRERSRPRPAADSHAGR